MEQLSLMFYGEQEQSPKIDSRSGLTAVPKEYFEQNPAKAGIPFEYRQSSLKKNKQKGQKIKKSS